MLSRIRYQILHNLKRAYHRQINPAKSLNRSSIDIRRKASAPSQEAVSTFQRLSFTYKLFKGDELFRKACIKCHDFYMKHELLLLEDLMSHPKINKDILSFLYLGFKDSKSMKAMIYQNLFDLLVRRKFSVFLDVMEQMNAVRLVSDATMNKLKNMNSAAIAEDEKLKLTAEAFLNEVISSGEPLIGASFAIQLLEGKVFLDSKVAEHLVLAFASSTTEPSFTAYTIHKLIKLYGHKNVSPSAKLDAINGMLKEPFVPFHANHLYDIARPLFPHNQHHASVLVNLIDSNTHKGHLFRATDLWKDLLEKFPETAMSEIKLIERLALKLADEDIERAADFLDTVPAEVRHSPDLLATSISVIGRSQNRYDEFTDLSRHLTAPLSRRALSSLFTSFLCQNNESASDKMLKAIFKTSSGLSPHDFEALIEKLLRHGKLEKSTEMCYNTDISVSKFGYIRVLEYVLSHGKTNHEFLDQFCRQFRKLKKTDPALHSFTTAIVRHFSRNLKNSLSRTLFISKAYKDAFYKLAGFNFRKLDLPDKFNELILIDNQNRIACLNIIYRQAVNEQDQVNIKWCLDELRSLGVSLGDIIAHYLKI